MSESSYPSSSAGPSSYPSQTPPPPPEAIERDDYAAAEQARQRFHKRGFFSAVSLPLPHRYRSKSRKRDSSPSPSSFAELERSTSVPQEAPDLVILSEGGLTAELDEDYGKDVYRWAVLYENQRGAMVFSTAYYSPLTLLPLDPPAFTIPTAIRSPRKNQPTVSLEDYPLPDGSWKWVSRAWMIDMRGDGQVQYDGFEYSRSFRSRKWGPNPGFMSNRGLVRRRRWIRLMMRPAQVHHDAESSLLSTLPELEHLEEGASRPPSVMLTPSSGSTVERDVWRGDGGDWGRCHIALRRLGRDGRKLELWASWLGVSEAAHLSRPTSWDPTIVPIVKVPLPGKAADGQPQTIREQYPANEPASRETNQAEADKLSADTGVSISPAPKAYVAAVLRTHAHDMLTLFVYPDSRAKFLSLLGRAGLLPDLRAGICAPDSVQILDFWSYTHDLGEDVGSEDQSRS
ncbi:hypothetical protein L226DRAFT_607651 [Lentinus tigrinus ALCF2SS1-7]|uniref:TECPR1-like DysF domain-containing protein n=1 Tax=Lentinus tigrinus ALCF2SS1-6 TaxID=1328759 RepID=A0A5C2SGN7_9APHY|nr:hypothetical protein L227DRAFT_651223 [Lentinus tigrinus ALCF2SS1-6]RPD82544.1 hypothetical protein L226DRAFT_607651 [Lentinus tigrinus ALCF2SS1-7]